MQRQETLISIRIAASEHCTQRGFLALLEGDIATAKKNLEQVHQLEVPEWGVPEQRNSTAEYFLHMIEHAGEIKARK
jgi:hypothetical protein